jgi:hypothetical protein
MNPEAFYGDNRTCSTMCLMNAAHASKGSEYFVGGVLSAVDDTNPTSKSVPSFRKNQVGLQR